MRRFESVLFDLDGTLTDPKAAITRSIQFALESLGRSAPGADELRWCIGPPLREIFERLLGTNARVEEAVELYFARYAAEGVSETRIYPGAAEMVSAIQADRTSVFLATAKLAEHAEKVLDAFGLRPWFTAVFGSRRDGSLADKTELVAFAVRDARIDRSRAVIVGDRRHDIVAGRQNGLFTVGVSYGYGSRLELEEAGADRICESPEAVAQLLSDLP